MPVEDAIGRAVERHVVGGARPGFGATALEQQTREHDQLGALRVALAVEELNAERQLAAGPPRRLEQPVREPSGVAVRLAEEGFRARRRPRLQPGQRRRVGVGRHGGNGRVHLERARPSPAIDEPVDTADEQLLGFAPAGAQRFLFQRREMVEEEPGAIRRPLDQLAADLDQRGDDQLGRPPERGQLLPGQRYRRQDQRDLLRTAHQPQLGGAVLREPRQLVAPRFGQGGEALVGCNGGRRQLGEVYPQVHGETTYNAGSRLWLAAWDDAPP